MTILREGFYKVEFSAAAPGAGGIVFIEGENVRGGDTQFIYSGRLSGTAGDLHLALSVIPFAPNASSVFGPVGGRFELALTGKADQSWIHLTGPSPFGGMGITIAARWITNKELTE